jgi:hypothetical protein
MCKLVLDTRHNRRGCTVLEKIASHLAHRTATAGNVERHRAHIARLDELHIAADFHNFSGNLMA